MNKIVKLSEEIISKVAAGQVIERPSSIVKELIENSIDAKATKIDIYIEDGGIKKVKVIDNGIGMTLEDLHLCYYKHTSSKVNSVSDLSNIKYFGFRGEALYAISNCSDVNISSRFYNSTQGNLLEIRSGKIVNERKSGHPKGTLVEVINIFKSLPARKQVLKSLKYEYSEVLKVILGYIVSYPQISFSFYHNNKEILNITKNIDEVERIKLLFKNLDTNFKTVKVNKDYLSVHGYISLPQYASYTNDSQYIFVNNRKVAVSFIPRIIKNSFSNLISSKQFPQFILFINIPPHYIDVNIHPRKETISFYNKQEIEEKIEDLVHDFLKNNDLTFFKKTTYNFDKEMYGFIADKLKKSTSPWNVKQDIKKKEIIQINDLYLITQLGSDLLLIDQHAAHEKILYNQFINSYKKEARKIKTFSIPVTFSVSFVQFELLKNNLKSINKLGFNIEEFGNYTFKVTKAPDVYKKEYIKEVIIEALDDIKKDSKIKNVSDSINKYVSYLACRTAIKANEYLTLKERRRLVKKVLDTKDQTYTCPHGRPVMVKIPLLELEKMFYRK